MDFSTTRLPPAERESGYRHALRRYFSEITADISVRVDTAEEAPLRASLEPLSIGQLMGGIHQCNAPHELRLPRTHLSGMDLYLLCEGDVSLSNANGTLELGPGDMILWPYGPEWEARSRRFRMIALGLPDAIIRRQKDELHAVAGRPISANGVLGACVGALLRTAAEFRGRISFEEGAALQDTILHALSTLAVTQKAVSSPPAGAERDAQLQRVKTLTLQSLDQVDLNPAMLAAQAGVSTRTLHRLFASSGTTFAEWLRQRRLARCWDELTRCGGRRRNIAAVALESGFGDLSTFNRAFRARFGMTPRAAQAQVPPAPETPVR
ncbi:MAG: helix-turn-helix domain-containing protein [Proteobacteria bacterium]|nr:helix-turn-helix domain-containing protein [Pseudomonadota bacterium]